MEGRRRADAALTPYVPRLQIEWLRDMPEVTYRSLNGTVMFADISGFTNLTERLAARGREGAEELYDVLNPRFEEILAAAYDFGGGLLKWGGDAVLILYEGDRHADRAARSASEIQAIMRRRGRVNTSAGTIRLGISIGIASGDVDLLLVGRRFRELIVTGPTATELARMESAAESGQILLSATTADLLTDGRDLGEQCGPGWLLRRGPDVDRSPSPVVRDPGVDLTQAFCSTLGDYLIEGAVESELRATAISFVQFTGVDDLLARLGPDALTQAVADLVVACQDSTAEHGVTILATDLAPDGGKLLLTAGVPTGFGDDETRMLSAVRRLIDTPNPLDVKAGINWGRVFAGDYGLPYRRTYSIAGDSVNLTARLAGKARPGEIVVTPVVLQRSRTKFGFEAIEPFPVKGKSELIHACLLGPALEAEAPTPAGDDMPLVGRAGEMATLLAAMDDARGGRGRVVELVGEPGMGKSRLMQELAGQCDATVLWTDGDVYSVSTPYVPLHRLFRQQVGPAQDALRTLIERRAPDLLAWLPLIAIPAGVEVAPTEDVDALDPEIRKDRLEEVTSEALGRILDGPVLFVFNDTYFMDQASADMIRRLAQDNDERPWLIVASTRPGARRVLDGIPGVINLDLEPLDAKASAELLTLTTERTPVPLYRLEALRERAGGNPLFLRELGAAVAQLDSLDAVPDSVDGVIAARIDRLRPRTRFLLRAASVLGMAFEMHLLTDLVEADEQFDAVTEQDWKDLGGFVDVVGSEVRIAQHLIRQTAYEGLTFRRRVILHARAADILEGRPDETDAAHIELVARHCFRGQRYLSAWGYARRAGDNARRTYSNVSAADFYGWALEAARHLPDLDRDQVADVFDALSETYVDMGEFELAEKQLGWSRSAANSDPLRRARTQLRMARLRHRGTRYSDALRWVTRGLETIASIESEEADRLRAELHEKYAQTLLTQGRHREAMARSRVAVEAARKARYPYVEALALDILLLAADLSGDTETGVDETASLKLFVELGDLKCQTRSHSFLGAKAYYRGDWDVARQHYASVVVCGEKTGRVFDAAIGRANEAEILIDQGKTAEARTVLDGAMRVWRATSANLDIAFGQQLQGRIAMREGDYDAAMEMLRRSRETFAGAGESYEVVTVEAFMAECHLCAERPEEASKLASSVLGRLPRGGGPASSVPTLERVRGEALRRAGEVEQGRVHLRASVAAARQRGALHELASSLRYLRSGWPEDPEGPAWAMEIAEIESRLGIVLPLMATVA